MSKIKFTLTHGITKKLLSVWCICLLFFGLSACRKELTNNPQANAERGITDDLGRRVRLPKKIERAVSLAPNLTEIVFAVNGGSRLVGVTSYCNYPEEAQKIPKIGDTVNPNLEAIIALKPQVILVSTASQIESFTETLEGQNIAVFVTNPKDVEGVYKSILKIGEIFGQDERARETIDRMQRRVNEIESKTNLSKKVKVFVQISKEPLFTIGKDSFLTDLIKRAGGVSLTENVAESYPKFSKETALALLPEAIILSDSEDNQEPNEVFANSPAMRNGKVFKIDADLLSRPSPRVVDALEQIARALHPDDFQ